MQTLQTTIDQVNLTSRNGFLKAFSLAGLALSICSWAFPSHAENSYPTKPIRWVVGTAAGGGTDILTRTVTNQMSKQIGQPIVVENRPGGGTTIAADFVARSPADGYTVLSADNGTLIFNQALFNNLSYNPEQDFTPLGMLAEFPLFVAVNNGVGIKKMADLAAMAKSQPGEISYATAGIGSPHQLAMEMLLDKADLDMVHVPYKGAAPALQDVVGGHVPVMITDAASGMQQLKSGSLIPLAVFGTDRHPLFPEVPTLIELGYTDVPMSAWVGVVVPKATPESTLQVLQDNLSNALKNTGVVAQIEGLGLMVLDGTQSQMQDYLSANTAYWLDLIDRKNIRFN